MKKLNFGTTTAAHSSGSRIIYGLFLFLLSSGAFADGTAPATVADAVYYLNNLWVVLCTLLVFFMTIPGVSMFYGGLVHRKNVVSTFIKSVAISSVIFVVWMIIGYSLAFGSGNWFIGDFSKFALNHIDFSHIAKNVMNPTISELTFFLYSASFACIAPTLIIGGFAERVKFLPCLIFSVLWSLLVYAPIAHMIWSDNGFLYKMHVIDFAGGLVVHVTSGVSGLVSAVMIGKRTVGESEDKYAHHSYSIVSSMVGAGLIWFGWFGFNGGSGSGFDSSTPLIILNTQIGATCGLIGWLFIELVMTRLMLSSGVIRATGMASGALAGLVAITPAAGFVTPHAAIIISLGAGVVCYFGCGLVKSRFGYDDALDAFGIHGVAGIYGSILVGLFASSKLSDTSHVSLFNQTAGTLAVILYTTVVSYILIKITDAIFGFRVDLNTETRGLDITQHGETIY